MSSAGFEPALRPSRGRVLVRYTTRTDCLAAARGAARFYEPRLNNEGGRGESNPLPRLSQSRVPSLYTTTTKFAPTRIRTRNLSVETRHDHPFHHRGVSGRQGTRTLLSLRRPTLAEWSGQPISGCLPISQWRPWESNPPQLACKACSPPWHMRPHSIAACGVARAARRKERELNPQGREARPFSRRLPSPIGLPFHAARSISARPRMSALMPGTNENSQPSVDAWLL